MHAKGYYIHEQNEKRKWVEGVDQYRKREGEENDFDPRVCILSVIVGEAN